MSYRIVGVNCIVDRNEHGKRQLRLRREVQLDWNGPRYYDWHKIYREIVEETPVESFIRCEIVWHDTSGERKQLLTDYADALQFKTVIESEIRKEQNLVTDTKRREYEEFITDLEKEILAQDEPHHSIERIVEGNTNSE